MDRGGGTNIAGSGAGTIGGKTIGTNALAQQWLEVADKMVQDDDSNKTKLNLSVSIDDDDEPINGLTPSKHLSDDDDAPLCRSTPIAQVEKLIANAMKLEK